MPLVKAGLSRRLVDRFPLPVQDIDMWKLSEFLCGIKDTHGLDIRGKSSTFCLGHLELC
jgi:hypothetical protein